MVRLMQRFPAKISQDTAWIKEDLNTNTISVSNVKYFSSRVTTSQSRD